MSGDLQLALLGKLEIRRDGEPIAGLDSAKAQALLGYLAVTGRPHFRTSLAGLLWGDMPETNARTNLRRELSALRRAVGEHLTITRQEVALNRDAAYWLDAEVFETAAAQGTIEALQRAVQLYRGDFLEGFYVRGAPAFEEWTLVQQTRLRELALQALHKLSAHYSEQGEAGFEEGIACTSRLLALEPSREEAHRQLMLLLAQSGQRGAALAQYETCRRALSEDLGVEPGPQTRELYQRIRDGEVARRPATLPGAKRFEPATDVPHNLPPQPTPFIGREGELADLDRLIADPDVRLIAIVGPGGMGKTRLALACAARQHPAEGQHPAERQVSQRHPAFPHGVYFVPLAALSAAEHIVPTLAEALNFPLQEGGGRTPRRQMLDYLRGRRMLLLMDSMEHLVDGSGLLVDVLESAPDVKLLVTSRERLNLQQEQVFPLHGLPFPETGTSAADVTGYAAVELFVQAARRVRPDFELTADVMTELIRVLNLVEGMPLSIELAASWIDMLSLADIAAEIQRGLDILETEWRDVPMRHRSIRAVIDASWGQLGADAQGIFRQLSVFRGGFTRDAARDLTGASLRTLTQLANKSLLFFNTDQGRYHVHELLRRYAAEKLASDPVEEAAVCDAHSAYFCTSLQGWEAELKGQRQTRALNEIGADIENIRVALNWAVKGRHVARINQALDALCRYYDRPFRPWEGQMLCQSIVEVLDGEDTQSPDALLLLAKALAWQAFFDAQAGVPSEPRLQRSLSLLDNPILAGRDITAHRAFLLKMAGYYDGSTDRNAAALEQAGSLLEQSLSLWRALGEEWEIAHTSAQLATVDAHLGNHDQARAACAESLATFRKLGDGWMVADTLLKLGQVLGRATEFGLAQQMFAESLQLARDQGNRAGIAASLWQLAKLAAYQGDLETAVSYAQENVNISRKAGTPYGLVVALAASGTLLNQAGKSARAAETLEEALSVAEELGLPVLRAWVEQCRARISLALGLYGEARAQAQRVVTIVREMKSENMVLKNLHTMGLAALAEGKVKDAQRHLLEGMAVHEVYPDDEYEPRLLAALGRTEYALGSRTEARGHLFRALEITLAKQNYMNLVHILPLIAVVLTDEEQDSLNERAVELYALAKSHPFIANSSLFEDIAGKHITAATAHLPADVVARAQERGRALDWWETAETLLDELDW